MKIKNLGSQIFKWIKNKYRIFVNALDEGERIHRRIQERKNEELLKASRHGFPTNFFQ